MGTALDKFFAGLAVRRPIRWIAFPFRRLASGMGDFLGEAKRPTDTVAYFNALAERQKLLLDHVAVVAPVFAAIVVAIKSMSLTRGDVAAALVVAGSFSLTQWALAIIISFAPLFYALLYQWRTASIPGREVTPPPYSVWVPVTMQSLVVVVVLGSIVIPRIFYIAVALLVIWALWVRGSPKKKDVPKASVGTKWYSEKNQDVVLEGIAKKLRALSEEDADSNNIAEQRRALHDEAALRQDDIHAATQKGRLIPNMLIAFGLTVPYVFSVATFPTENIRFESEELSAYVLRVDSEWTTLLERESREVRYLPTPAVRERELCAAGGSRTSIWSAILRPPAAQAREYARCAGA